MTSNADKHLTPLHVRENIFDSREGEKILPKFNHPYPPPPQKSTGQPRMGWVKKLIEHLGNCHLSTVINKMAFITFRGP